MFLKRKSLGKAAEILKETQILYINGIRQCGKSTIDDSTFRRYCNILFDALRERKSKVQDLI